MDTQSSPRPSRGLTGIGSIVVLIAIVVTAGVSWLLYEHTVTLLTENLRQRLLSIAITQAANIDAKNLDALHIEQDWKKPEWTRVVNRLKKTKDGNPNIVFMYIFRKKQSDPMQLEFVADAESINPYANTDADPTNDVDANGDGKIEPDGADQLQWPGQDYPTPPEEAFEAFNGPLTNRSLYSDSYGQVLTGYAPIKDGSGNVVAVIGTDIKVNDFLTVTRQTLYPFLLFIIFLVFAMVILSAALIQIWNKRVALLARIDQQKNSVIHTVAHQLNTLVAGLKWSAEMLRTGDMTKEACAETVETETTELKDLAAMFLEAAHIQKGQLEIKAAPLELNAFFKEIVKEANNQAHEMKVTLKTSIAATLPTAMFDRNYTQLVMKNLLSNAIKYTAAKPGHGRVDFTIKVAGKTLSCIVKDTGIGIPKKEYGNIFGQMYRASNAVEAVKDGNGLGLYATQAAVKAQGGIIRFESQEGMGTTFYVELPLNRADKTKRTQSQ